MVNLDYDERADVLYVLRNGSKIVDSGYGEDSYVILNWESSKQVVGTQILASSEMTLAFWLQHPDRPEFPSDVLDAIDGWYRSRV